MPRTVIPKEAHALVRQMSARGMSYAQIGNAFGVSGSRVKQIVRGYQQVKREDGTWAVVKEVPGDSD